jgi:hypothetical protein
LNASALSPLAQRLVGAITRNVDAVATAAAQYGGEGISFGFSLASAPTIEIVPIGGPGTANRPGSLASPTAAPGYLCIYQKSENNVSNFEICPHAGLYNQTADPFGGEVVVGSAGAGRFYEDGTWAATAP